MKARLTLGLVSLLVIGGFQLVAFTGPPQKNVPPLRSSMPAGYEVLLLKPSNSTLSLMGLIECPELEGAHRVSEGADATLVSADGAPIKEFPHRFSFRVTASLRKTVTDGPITTINLPGDPNELLLKLRFRVRAYHGLEVNELNPESVEMIGMPADVPYDERVYRIHMNVGNLPVSDRLIIEVLSPQDEVLTHFLFGLL
jgi:hypothetical protein